MKHKLECEEFFEKFSKNFLEEPLEKFLENLGYLAMKKLQFFVAWWKKHIFLRSTELYCGLIS